MGAYMSFILKNQSFKVVNAGNSFGFFVSSRSNYYLLLHIKLSTFFFSSQVLDLFSYQLNYNKGIDGVVSYIISSLLFSKNFLIFIIKRTNKPIFSISELFQNLNWLERESSELSGVIFLNKKDTRNLMLPYGDTSNPFLKEFPVIGFRELYYNSIYDTIVSEPVSIQF